MLVPGRADEWAARLPLLQLSLNSAVNASTGVSPMYAMAGYVPSDPLLLDVRAATQGLSHATDALTFVTRRNQALLDIKESEPVRHRQLQAQWSKRHPQRRIPVVGDTVFIAAEGLISREATPKTSLGRPWVGPARVVAVDTPNVTMTLPASHKGKEVTLHLKYVKLASERSEEWEMDNLPAVDEEGDLFEIDRIVDIAGTKSDPSYLVTYKGYDPLLHQHWVSDVDADDLISRFLRSAPASKRRQLRGVLHKRFQPLLEEEVEQPVSEDEDEVIRNSA